MYTVYPNGTVTKEGKGFIPPDPMNKDYAEYLAWCAEGNESRPVDPEPEPEKPRDLEAEIDAIKKQIGMK